VREEDEKRDRVAAENGGRKKGEKVKHIWSAAVAFL
jgi:hypothetical protein